ncbi:MAG: hypothetical protein E6J14_15155 [Chloroflexi bacterium]|nr:MAG: hypothetical protein E6J14_15155 [Chloroflexota bacterium]
MSPATADQVAVAFHNAGYLGELLSIIRQPASGEPPDLRHFRPAALAAWHRQSQQPTRDHGSVKGFGGAAGSARSGGPGAGPPPFSPLAPLGLVPILVMAGTGRGRRLIRRMVQAVVLPVRRWLPARDRLPPPLRGIARHPVRTMALTLGPVAFVGLLGLSVGANPAALVGEGPGGTGPGTSRSGGSSAQSAGREGILAVVLPQGPPVWQRLVSVESSIAFLQDRLAQQETEIQQFALAAAAMPNSPAPAAAPEPAASDHLAQLIDSRDSTNQLYRTALRVEYSIYLDTARDQTEQQALLAAVEQEAASIRDAVDYDLNVAGTQVGQEAAIAAAQQKLQELTSLSATQLQQIKAGQPFMLPLAGTLTQPFGATDFGLEPPLVYHGVFYPHFHTGLDLAAPLDAPVRAAADGVVLLATSSVDSQGHYVGYGNYVLIAHPDGFATLYGHLDRIGVSAGQLVHQGDAIGLEGSTGWSTGPHVHFEIRHKGELLDPAPYLAPGQR